ncbi:hypothetical protein [Oculatella sp. LEGE 06141]|nr:hypothetical protein [Oculatella sp. LEGE 06141]
MVTILPGAIASPCGSLEITAVLNQVSHSLAKMGWGVGGGMW